jgi:hypothetical protein
MLLLTNLPALQVSRIAVDESWVAIESLPDFVDILQTAPPTPMTAERAALEDDAVSSASSE